MPNYSDHMMKRASDEMMASSEGYSEQADREIRRDGRS